MASRPTVPSDRDSRRPDVMAAQVRLLFQNVTVGAAVTVLVATVLALLEWGTASQPVIVGWWVYMIVVAGCRYALSVRWRQSSPGPAETGWWRAAFAAGAGLAGMGWGAAGILLYQEMQTPNQVFLVFVLGGMMLGAAST